MFYKIQNQLIKSNLQVLSLMKFILKVQKTALHIAVEKNNHNIIKLLLQHKNINIKAQDEI